MQIVSRHPLKWKATAHAFLVSTISLNRDELCLGHLVVFLLTSRAIFGEESEAAW
jgi:hypothetical protein